MKKFVCFYKTSPTEFNFGKGVENIISLVIERVTGDYNEKIKAIEILDAFNPRYNRIELENYSIDYSKNSILLFRELTPEKKRIIVNYKLINLHGGEYPYQPRLLVKINNEYVEMPLQSHIEEEVEKAPQIVTFKITKRRKKVEIEVHGLPEPLAENARITLNLRKLENSEIFGEIANRIKAAPTFRRGTTLDKRLLLGLGGLLYNELNTDEKLEVIESALDKYNISYLWFHGDVHAIPWEILRTERQFWGTKYSISRWFHDPGESNEYYLTREFSTVKPLKIFVIASNFNVHDILEYSEHGDDYIQKSKLPSLNVFKEAEELKKLKDKWVNDIDIHILEIDREEIRYWENYTLKDSKKIGRTHLSKEKFDRIKKKKTATWKEKAEKILSLIGMYLNSVDFDILHLAGEHVFLKYETATKARKSTKRKSRVAKEDIFVVTPIPDPKLQITPKKIKSWFGKRKKNKIFLTFGNFCNSAGDEFLHETAKTLSFVKNTLSFSFTFIGSYNFVPADYGPIFAMRFYNQLMQSIHDKKSNPISTVLRKTRESFMKDYPDEITWAWFVHYGYPLSFIKLMEP